MSVLSHKLLEGVLFCKTLFIWVKHNSPLYFIRIVYSFSVANITEFLVTLRRLRPRTLEPLALRPFFSICDNWSGSRRVTWRLGVRGFPLSLVISRVITTTSLHWCQPPTYLCSSVSFMLKGTDKKRSQLSCPTTSDWNYNCGVFACSKLSDDILLWSLTTSSSYSCLTFVNVKCLINVFGLFF